MRGDNQLPRQVSGALRITPQGYVYEVHLPGGTKNTGYHPSVKEAHVAAVTLAQEAGYIFA